MCYSLSRGKKHREKVNFLVSQFVTFDCVVSLLLLRLQGVGIQRQGQTESFLSIMKLPTSPDASDNLVDLVHAMSVAASPHSVEHGGGKRQMTKVSPWRLVVLLWRVQKIIMVRCLVIISRGYRRCFRFSCKQQETQREDEASGSLHASSRISIVKSPVCNKARRGKNKWS